MDSVGIGMGLLDPDCRFVEANRTLAEAFGLESVLGLGISQLPPSGERNQSVVRQVFRTGRPISIDAVRGRVSYFRVLDADGNPIGISAVAMADSPALLHLAQLKLEAETDGLTGLMNHRAFQERLRLEFRRARRHRRPLSLAMIDVDGFKQLNDTYGHQVGDDALQRVAAHLALGLRASDSVARIGGDEFALLLPETDGDGAQIVLERAHDQIRRDRHKPGAAEFTVSIGICDLEHAGSADELLRFADGALYWAKAHGRDALCQYSAETVEDLSREQRADRLLRNKSLAGIRSLARAIDAKDHSTLLHSERVASLAARLAEALDWSPARVAALRETALIHDVGKIGVPKEVLLKPGALTPSEYDLIKSHAMLGAAIGGEVMNDEQTAWLRGHHERFDGTGYPDRIAGEAIPDGARILAVADSWDVMTSERSYSPAMDTTEAIAECRRCAGSHFDPEVVEVLSRPGFERILRMFANEQSTRNRNEASTADDASATFHLHCECGAEDCRAMIDIPADDYRAIRQSERCYIVHGGHEIPEIESTRITTGHYTVVEKI